MALIMSLLTFHCSLVSAKQMIQAEISDYL